MKFKELIKNKDILKSLEDLKYETPTEIQEKIIPLILDGNDVLGQSQTGTGKTIAFALPILENIEANKVIQTLVLAPTRELAIQIERDIEQLSKYTNINTTCVYGSSSIEEQMRSIKKGCEIVVGTPGRVKDLIKRRVLKLTEIKYFVLDESDEMLSMGFQEELEFIFEKINNDKQVMLFSATMPKQILKIAENYMSKDYKMISVISKEQTAKNVEQEYYLIKSNTRLESLCRIVDYYNPKRSMIFCRTKKNADEVLEKLSQRGYSVDVIHGDITQGQRIATLDRFKSGLFNFLIATDVAARGIHVNNVDIVINYNLPESNEAYVHRIGRTGRANESGLAITLATESEEKIIEQIKNHIKSNITKKTIPLKNDIMTKRVDVITSLSDSYKDSNFDKSIFKEYLENLSENDLKSILNQLLIEKLNQSIGSDFDVELSQVKSKKPKKRELSDSTRIFLTIGKLDNIEKRSFLTFLEKKADIKEGSFSGMEIMTKFTFVNVKNNCLDKVLKKCNNIRYNDRLIRIEKAKK